MTGRRLAFPELENPKFSTEYVQYTALFVARAYANQHRFSDNTTVYLVRVATAVQKICVG